MKHFPPQSVVPYDIDVLTPDEFLVHQFHLNHELLKEKFAAQAAARSIPAHALLGQLARWLPNCIRLLREGSHWATPKGV